MTEKLFPSHSEMENHLPQSVLGSSPQLSWRSRKGWWGPACRRALAWRRKRATGAWTAPVWMTPTPWERAWRGAPSAAPCETSPKQVQPIFACFYHLGLSFFSSTALWWYRGDKNSKMLFHGTIHQFLEFSPLNPVYNSLMIG